MFNEFSKKQGPIQGMAGLGGGATSKIIITASGPAEGDEFEGGFLICQNSNVYWIVSPSSSEVSRSWNNRNDANTRAQQVSGCTGWFVPTMAQLRNPGYECRTHWDSYSSANYWSCEEHPNLANYGGYGYACLHGFSNNIPNPSPKPGTMCVRSFRCVTY